MQRYWKWIHRLTRADGFETLGSGRSNTFTTSYYLFAIAFIRDLSPLVKYNR